MNGTRAESYREHARNCARLASGARHDAIRKAFRQLKRTWLRLAREHEWMDDHPHGRSGTATHV